MTLTRGQISATVDPLGWRLLLGAVYTQVRVASLVSAAEAASIAIAAAGADGDAHLTADVQTDRVLLRLQSTADGNVTEHDLRLARQVTEALAARSLTTEPGDRQIALQAVEIAIDALDIGAVRPFWRAVTGYVDEPGLPDLPDTALVDPLGRSPTIWFQQMDAPRPQRNRIHLDIDIAPELARARVDTALAAGGTLLSDRAAPAFWVLADAEGNEVCVCTWQGRD